ncbi:alanine and proline-rich secreted protein Apa [Mycobacterium sp. NBC_00419]|uniref:APA family fibronectin-binding glycoprotein n=1 Tax=Mycobacterium sp. NBC_00419 TaxID=2975989 RepID=UPI002E1D0362
MSEPDPTSRRTGLWTALAVTAVTAASAVTIALPSTTATADPATPTPSTTAAPPAAPPASPVPPPPADPNAPPAATVEPAPAPLDPNAPPPPPADPNAPPADPSAAPAPPPEPGRVNNATGGFSYLLPAGWVVSDASRLNYGQALLSKETGPSQNGQPAPTANDTSVLLGRLDLKLFAGAEQDNSKAAVRLASDMGEFFMPFPGVRVNQQTGALQAGDLPGYFSSYEVKFTDTSKPNGQIWAGVVGNANPNAPRTERNQRWFVVWLGTGKDPIDPAAAKALAESIKPYSPPPPPAPDPNAPAPAAPAPGNRVGIPIPVETPVPEMMPAG